MDTACLTASFLVLPALILSSVATLTAQVVRARRRRAHPISEP